MNEEANKYKFDNLQPISFLKKFNSMIQEDVKHPLKPNRGQHKIIPLTKFPLPAFYQKMEGIFETGIKKKDIMSSHSKSKQDVQDEQFLCHHRELMTKVIQKIIKQNEHQQRNLVNYKEQYNKNRVQKDKKSIRSFSESKLNKNISNLSIPKIKQNSKQYSTLLVRQKTQKQQKPVQVPESTYLEKVKIQRFQSLRNIKNQKIKFIQNSKVTQYLKTKDKCLTQRKLQNSHTNNQVNLIKTSRSIVSDNNQPKVEDWKKIFMQDLQNLQKEQKAYQSSYSDRVQNQIKNFNEKIKKSVQKTQQQRFW